MRATPPDLLPARVVAAPPSHGQSIVMLVIRQSWPSAPRAADPADSAAVVARASSLVKAANSSVLQTSGSTLDKRSPDSMC